MAGLIEWTQGLKEYSFSDNAMQLDGTILYRLKMIDENSVFKYSNIVAVKIPANNGEIVLYPNPAGSFLTISFRHPVHRLTAIYVYDAAGRIVYMKNILPGQTVSRLDISTLKNGYYTLKMASDEQTGYTKFLKQD
jgi:hypothetical protein